MYLIKSLFSAMCRFDLSNINSISIIKLCIQLPNCVLYAAPNRVGEGGGGGGGGGQGWSQNSPGLLEIGKPLCRGLFTARSLRVAQIFFLGPESYNQSPRFSI